MPPRMTFTREAILQAALALTDSIGIQELSTRKVAERLHASQAPIYSQFKNIEELKEEVLRAAKEMLLSFADQAYTVNSFLNLGVGIVVFSREHRHLFQALSSQKDIINEVFDLCAEFMLRDQHFAEIPLSIRRKILQKTTIMTFGLADLMAKDFIENDSNEAIIKTMAEMGQVIIAAEIENFKKGGI